MSVDLLLFDKGHHVIKLVSLAKIKASIKPRAIPYRTQVFHNLAWYQKTGVLRTRINPYRMYNKFALWIALPHCTLARYKAWCEESWFGQTSV